MSASSDQRASDQSSRVLMCPATKRDGSPCRARALPGAAYCLSHDPARAAALRESRRRGGLNRRRSLPPDAATEAVNLTTVAGAQQLLERAARTALACDASLAQARTLASIALAAAKLLEVGELDARLTELEALALRALDRTTARTAPAVQVLQ